MSNQNERSRILLVCLGSEKEKDELQKVTARVLFKIFRPFGQLNKIILFSRSPFVKAFVEYCGIEDADSARQIIHDTPIDNYGTARIFASKLSSLSCTNKFIDVLEISKEDDLKIYDEHSTHHSSHNNLWSRPPMSLGHPLSEENFPITPVFGRMSQFDFYDDQETINKIPQINTEKPNKKENFYFDVNRKTSFNTTATENSKIQKDKDPSALSTVLLVSNVDSNFLNSRELYNLFSCFGNLSKVLYMKNLRKVLLEYERIESAQNCLIYMHNRPIGKCKLKANFSKFQTINLKKNNKSSLSQQYNDVTKGTNETHRFQNDGLVRITPPSATLIFSCKKQDYILPSDIYLLAEQFYKPLKIRLLKAEENLDNTCEKETRLKVELEFNGIKEAAFVLAKCHNTILKSEKLDVSFSAMNII